MLSAALAFCVLSPSLPGPPAAGQYVVPPTRAGEEVRADEHGNLATAVRDVLEPRERGATSAPRGLTPAAWEPIGPYGGDAFAVGASPVMPTMVLAGLAPGGSTGGTMFRSTDSGGSWSEVATFSGRSVYDIEYTPAGVVYAGTMDGVWKSTDHGVNWTQLPLGIGVNDQTFDVEIDPSDSQRIWAGVADAIGSQPNTLLLSTDGGASWTPKVPAGGPYSFSAIEVHPSDSNKVYAAWQGSFGGGGVFVSANGGTSWTDRSAGLPANPMQDLEHDGTRLLLCGGQLFGSQIVGIWTTSNDGVSWTELSNAGWPLRVFHDLELEPGNASHILAASVGNGIYESIDGGANWSFGVGGTSGLSCNEVSYVPGSASEIFVGSSSNAVWKSANGGTTYQPASFGIGQLNVYSIAANPVNPLEIAIAYQGLNDGGLQTSTNGGLTWSGEAVPGTRWNTVRFDETGTLYAISDGPTTIAAEGVYRRTGSSWASIGPDQGTYFESELLPINFEAGDPLTILAGGADFGVAGFEPTVWKTTDGGVNWIKTYEGAIDHEDVTDLEWAPGVVNQLVACYTDFGSTPQTGGALRSTDNGDSWIDSSTGLAAETQGNSLSVSADGTTVFLADADSGTGNGGLFQTTNGGVSWTLVNGAAGRTLRVVCHPSVAAQLFTTQGSTPKVRASEDAGVNLGAYDAGLTPSLWAQDLHLDASASVLYLASNEGSWRQVLNVGTKYCAGDGSGTTCPCGNNNNGELGGCDWGNTSFPGGGVLDATGSASMAANDTLLVATGIENNFGIFFGANDQVNGGNGNPLNDGLRCAGGALVRLVPPTPATGNQAVLPQPVQTLDTGAAAGVTRRYQYWFRTPNGPCGTSANLTNGYEIVWGA